MVDNKKALTLKEVMSRVYGIDPKLSLREIMKRVYGSTKKSGGKINKKKK